MNALEHGFASRLIAAVVSASAGGLVALTAVAAQPGGPWTPSPDHAVRFVPVTTKVTPTQAPVNRARKAKTPEEIEDETWAAIQNSKDVRDYDTYLRDYPNGRYVTKARAQRDRLARPTEEAEPAAPKKAATPAARPAEPAAAAAKGVRPEVAAAAAGAAAATGAGMTLASLSGKHYYGRAVNDKGTVWVIEGTFEAGKFKLSRFRMTQSPSYFDLRCSPELTRMGISGILQGGLGGILDNALAIDDKLQFSGLCQSNEGGAGAGEGGSDNRRTMSGRFPMVRIEAVGSVGGADVLLMDIALKSDYNEAMKASPNLSTERWITTRR